MYLVAECCEYGNIHYNVVWKIHRVSLHFQLVHNLHKIRTGLYRRRDANELKRNMNFNFLAFSDCIKVHVTREIRERVQVNFVNKSWKSITKSCERHNSRLACLLQYFSKGDRRYGD